MDTSLGISGEYGCAARFDGFSFVFMAGHPNFVVFFLMELRGCTIGFSPSPFLFYYSAYSSRLNIFVVFHSSLDDGLDKFPVEKLFC